MPNHRRQLLPLCIAASLFSGWSAGAAAIGVGEIQLQSFLGAPLQAEIPLNHLGELGVDQLKVQLGSQDDYGAMGVDYTYLHSQFKIEPIVKNGLGYVRISTREPITEPYLNFVLNLRWPQGQLVREFTVLLDPPTQAVAAAAPAAATIHQPSVRQASAPVAEALGQEAQDAPVAAAASETARAGKVSAAPKRARKTGGETAAPLTGDALYTIRRGDSLWRIASRMRTPAPVEQVMAAILANNPDAFINGNPNLMKEAVTIALPDAQQIAAVATGGARAIAESIAESTADDAPVAAAASSGAVPPVAALVEENSALKAQVSELTGNVAALNDNLVQSERRLHQLEDQLNELIQQMQQQRATVAALRGDPAPQGAELVQSTGSVINQVNAADLHGQGKAHTPWWVHLLYWLGIGGAMTWAVREHFWPQRRLSAASVGGGAPMPAREAQSPVLAARTAMAAPAGITTVREAAELEIDELPLPFDPVIENSPAAAPEPAPQLLRNNDEPVDASISAGVFVAFGRYGEAEHLLREALARDPARIDLKLQLLDVLMQSDQPGAFDDLAAEIESEARTPEDLAELAVLRDSYRPRHGH